MQSNEKIIAETTAGSSVNEGLGAIESLSHTKQTYTMKMDLRLIPILGCTYTILFLDRTNSKSTFQIRGASTKLTTSCVVANARIEGMEKSLQMPATGYNTALWIFYIPFVLVEVPSNIIMSLPRVRPNLFLGSNMLILGVVASCQGLTASYAGLLVCRFLMGIFEATLPAGECVPSEEESKTALDNDRCGFATCGVLYSQAGVPSVRNVLHLWSSRALLQRSTGVRYSRNGRDSRQRRLEMDLHPRRSHYNRHLFSSVLPCSRLSRADEHLERVGERASARDAALRQGRTTDRCQRNELDQGHFRLQDSVSVSLLAVSACSAADFTWEVHSCSFVAI